MIRFTTPTQLRTELEHTFQPDEPLAVLIVSRREILDDLANTHEQHMEYEDADKRTAFVAPSDTRIALAIERTVNAMERRSEDNHWLDFAVDRVVFP
jgi:hypothetical protein